MRTLQFLRYIAVFLTLPLLLHCHAPRTFAGAEITGCYSDLRYSDESGDLIGYEVTIVDSNTGYYVLYQESEGFPTVLHLLPLTVEGTKIQFTVPEAKNTNCSGTITAAGLHGTFLHPDNIVTLPKKTSYWAGDWRRPKTGFYANISAGTAADAGTKYKIFIVFTDKGYHALYQEIGDTPQKPLLFPVNIIDTPDNTEGTTALFSAPIHFSVPTADGYSKQFEGIITKDGLRGRFDSGGETLFLARVNAW